MSGLYKQGIAESSDCLVKIEEPGRQKKKKKKKKNKGGLGDKKKKKEKEKEKNEKLWEAR